MNQTEKLTKVFDFIAEYLSETKEVVNHYETPTTNNHSESIDNSEDSFKRAYALMKKLDERDKVNSVVINEVRKATEPFKEELNRIKKEYDEKLNLQVEEETEELSDYISESLSNQLEIKAKAYSKKKTTNKGDVVTTVEIKPTKSILEK